MSAHKVPIAFVTGGTGKQGGATARELLKAKVQVHALVRDPSSKAAVELQRLGARLFHGSFDDVPALKKATHGTTAVFLNLMPSRADPGDEVRHAKNVIDAAKSSDTVSHLVYSSVSMTGKHESFPNWGSDHPMFDYWTSKAEVESLVRSSGIEHWTILRPAFLMHNYHLPVAAYMFAPLVQKHTFLTAYTPTSAMTVLDAEDVGKFASAAILDPKSFDKDVIELGVEALTPAEIAQQLSAASGKKIRAEFYSMEEIQAMIQDSPGLQGPVIQAQLWANDVGYQVDFKALEKYPVKLTTFAEYLKGHKDDIDRVFA